MTLAPLLQAPLPIQLHAFAAMGAFALGIVQLAGVKGNLQHRTLGYLWAALMLVVAVSSFWIHEIRLVGPYSPIHILSITTLVSLPLAIHYARGHRVAAHKRVMLALFFGALLIAGLFTLLPGRILGRVMFGG